jgi:hypothetical protein
MRSVRRRRGAWLPIQLSEKIRNSLIGYGEPSWEPHRYELDSAALRIFATAPRPLVDGLRFQLAIAWGEFLRGLLE